MANGLIYGLTIETRTEEVTHRTNPLNPIASKPSAYW